MIRFIVHHAFLSLLSSKEKSEGTGFGVVLGGMWSQGAEVHSSS